MKFLPGGQVKVCEGRDLSDDRPPGTPKVERTASQKDFELQGYQRQISKANLWEVQMTHCSVNCVTAVVEHLAKRASHARATRLFAK